LPPLGKKGKEKEKEKEIEKEKEKEKEKSFPPCAKGKALRVELALVRLEQVVQSAWPTPRGFPALCCTGWMSACARVCARVCVPWECCLFSAL
jgi:hypothetical protein